VHHRCERHLAALSGSHGGPIVVSGARASPFDIESKRAASPGLGDDLDPGAHAPVLGSSQGVRPRGPVWGKRQGRSSGHRARCPPDRPRASRLRESGTTRAHSCIRECERHPRPVLGTVARAPESDRARVVWLGPKGGASDDAGVCAICTGLAKPTCLRRSGAHGGLDARLGASHLQSTSESGRMRTRSRWDRAGATTGPAFRQRAPERPLRRERRPGGHPVPRDRSERL
jgi:hypothetical protein